MSICPGYWAWVLQSHAQGRVASITSVRDEMRRKNKFIIPNVCRDFGVTWADTFQVLGATGARFELLPASP